MAQTVSGSEFEKWLTYYDNNNGQNGNGWLTFEEVDHQFRKCLEQIPGEYKQTLTDIVNQIASVASHYYYNRTRTDEVERHVVREAHVFDGNVETIAEVNALNINQLRYLGDRLINKHKLMAIAEGAVAGIGHPLLICADFPALLAINLRMIHYISAVYGFSFQSVHEVDNACKVLHAASLPKQYRKQAWQWLQEAYTEHPSTYAYSSTIIEREWLEVLAKQWLKSAVLYSFRRSSKRRLSIMGMIMGANANYLFTKQIGEFSRYFYQERWLRSKAN